MKDDDDDAQPAKEQRAVQSVEVGGKLLLALADDPRPMTLKELAARAGLPASRAHPYLVSYVKLGLVEQDSASARYGLGPAALQLGLAALHQSDPIKAAGPVAEALACEIDQTVALAVWANFGPTIVRMVEGSRPLHVAMRAGTVMSILGTATGRAFAAVLPRWRMERSLTGPIGDASGLDPSALLQGLDDDLDVAVTEMREHGLARAVGRPIPGVNAFSAPVFDHEGQPALVITALGHADMFPTAWDSAPALAVRRAAAEVSRRLGWRGDGQAADAAGTAPEPATTDGRPTRDRAAAAG